jgi:hypothetical protein
LWIIYVSFTFTHQFVMGGFDPHGVIAAVVVSPEGIGPVVAHIAVQVALAGDKRIACPPPGRIPAMVLDNLPGRIDKVARPVDEAVPVADEVAEVSASCSGN